jgi:hypothetical protein
MKNFNKGKIALINANIADFMGAETVDESSGLLNPSLCLNMIHPLKNANKIYVSITELKYHSSWDWLMPVINKIATYVRFRTRFHMSGFPINVSISGHGGVHIAINQGNCAGEEYKGDRIIADTMNLNYCINDDTMAYKPIELAWIAVDRFMVWMKKNKENVVTL